MAVSERASKWILAVSFVVALPVAVLIFVYADGTWALRLILALLGLMTVCACFWGGSVACV